MDQLYDSRPVWNLRGRTFFKEHLPKVSLRPDPGYTFMYSTDGTVMSQSDCISSRGVGFLPDVPKFFDVLNILWHPETNPEGTVNLGLAENVRRHHTTYIHLR